MRGMDEPGAIATAAYWFGQSVVSFFDHRRAEHLLRCTTEGMGITPREVHALALDDTLDHFRGNYLGWSEAQVAEVIEAASRCATDAQEQPGFDRVVVVEISECGDGLNWLDGQGDLSAPGNDLFWVALDANADPKHNLQLLNEVKRHRLEQRFAEDPGVSGDAGGYRRGQRPGEWRASGRPFAAHG